MYENEFQPLLFTLCPRPPQSAALADSRPSLLPSLFTPSFHSVGGATNSAWLEVLLPCFLSESATTKSPNWKTEGPVSKGGGSLTAASFASAKEAAFGACSSPGIWDLWLVGWRVLLVISPPPGADAHLTATERGWDDFNWSSVFVKISFLSPGAFK